MTCVTESFEILVILVEILTGTMLIYMDPIFTLFFQDSVFFFNDGIGPIRTEKRKIVVSNKKERRRTQSINAAFSSLRDCIPNVPCDTKLSKVNKILHTLDH